ncbi:hypothetical protein MNBD_NITROSPIRAE01-1392 [hydrothermal vent metagenome]|uniref:Uncharacterized protein n=1 Tax=hydrothermal vent metagenome TaxID=652676 RepID=A0A3B1DDF0_9ZZZZ
MEGCFVPILRALSERTKTILNVVLLLLQLITISAYAGMVYSKEEIRSISHGLYPNSDQLMNSNLLELMLSSGLVWGLSAIFVASIIKEFKFKDKNRKVRLNMGILLFIASLFALVSYRIYAPILEMS